MVFCHKLVFPATDTGYSLQDLLTAAGFTPAFPRVAGVKIGYTAELGTDAYIVPNKGSYANTGGVPDDYGIASLLKDRSGNFISRQTLSLWMKSSSVLRPRVTTSFSGHIVCNES